jgi:DNA replication protein DnaC
MFKKPKPENVVNCSKCVGSVFCEGCNDKYKKPWRELFPPRYKDASLSMAKYLSGNDIGTINSFVDKVLAKDHTGKTGLFIFGNLGIGKTWLLHAVLNEIINKADLKRTITCPVGVIDCKEMVFDFHYRYVGKGDMSITQYVEEIVNFTRTGVIALDDMGHGNTTKEEFAINIFNLLLDDIYTHLGFVAITSNHSPLDLKSYLGPYAVDRIMDMCGDNVIELKGKSQRLM